MNEIASKTSNQVTNLSIKRGNVNTTVSDAKLDITYFVTAENSFILPEVIEGEDLDSSIENPILLDVTFKAQDIKLGDIIKDTTTGIPLTVVGFVGDEIFSHSPVGFILTDTFTAMNLEVNPNYIEKYNAVLVQGSDIANINIDGLEVIDKNTVVNKLPGYEAEQLTINMILWVLVIISAAILGVFFYVITIQKQKQFGVLKAIGMKMSELSRYILSQVLILSVSGVVIGNGIAIAMASMLPSSMPFSLKIPSVIMISIIFIIITLCTSLASIRRVAKVDPMVIIGGNE